LSGADDTGLATRLRLMYDQSSSQIAKDRR